MASALAAAADPAPTLSHTRLRTLPRRAYTADVPAPTTVCLTPIGVARTPYTERFGTPRQPQVTAGALGGGALAGRIELSLDAVAGSNALRGLDGFSHVWAIYLCHLNTGWSPLVQPPRGPRVKQGVFATRSPHRPNSIGLSLLRISRVDERARVIHFLGGDLLDGTPILDVKPYIHAYDSAKDAAHGWLDKLDSILDEPDTLRYSPPPSSLLGFVVTGTSTDGTVPLMTASVRGARARAASV